jgi:diaminopropionate ammonia-lyase
MSSILLNPHHANLSARQAAARNVFSEAGFEEAASIIRAWHGYAPTPLVELPGTAELCEVASVLYKDESQRFGLGSFKALGGSYAAFRLARKHLEERLGGQAIDSARLFGGGYSLELDTFVLCCATDGNHGRAVAWAAQQVGCKCIVFLHENVSIGREEALRRLGAQVLRVPGTYDDSVEAAAAQAAANGWFLVSDTSYAGYTDIPVWVMDGYRVMVQECLDVQPDLMRRVTHVFLQGGVGGLAAAVAAHLLARLPAPPRFVIVEPNSADCLRQSARRGRAMRIEGSLETVMAGLSCGEPSLVAWGVLQPCVDAFLTIGDEEAIAAMRQVAHGARGDPALVAGESGAAAYAALWTVSASPNDRASLGIDGDSRILLFGTEGATDPELYGQLVRGL